MLTLHHIGGAICAQKVRLALAEKGVAWDSRELPLSCLRDPDYLKLNPNGVVPTLVHGETVLIESRIISEYVNDAFDGPALMSSDPVARHRARYWSKQVDDSLHLNVFILTFAMGMRDMFLKLPEEARAVALPGLRDPIKRRISIDLLDQHWGAPWAAMAAKRFHQLVADMEADLAGATYLSGDNYSLADADYTAYFNRLTELGFEGLWAGTPAVSDWWARMKLRPSFKTAILDWNVPADVERYRTMRARWPDKIREMVEAD